MIFDQWQRIAELFVLPPGVNLLLLLFGLLWWRRRIARMAVALATISLLIFSLPAFSNLLFSHLEPYPALTATNLTQPADAIVVLGAGQHIHQPEYGNRNVIDALSFARIRYAAWLHDRTGLPVLVSGGRPDAVGTPLARLAGFMLKRRYRVDRVILEDRSTTTRENARFSARLLKQHGWRRIYLVSHAWHLPRAVPEFERAGIEVIPAPTAFQHRKRPMKQVSDWLPSAKALLKSYYGLHELLGRVWYRLLAMNT